MQRKLKHLLLIHIIFTPFFVLAQTQLRCPPIDSKGFGKQKIDVTIGAGPTFLYGDLLELESNMGIGFVVKGDYNIYRGLYGGLEFQTGRLKAKGEVQIATDEGSTTIPREVNNRYLAGTINLTVYPYRFFVTERELFRKPKYHQLLLNGIYAGVGLGTISNRHQDQGEDDPDRLALNSSDMLFPVVNFGVVMPFNKYTTRTSGYFSGVINAQANFSTGDNLDRERPDGSENNDVYNFIYLGLRYSF